MVTVALQLGCPKELLTQEALSAHESCPTTSVAEPAPPQPLPPPVTEARAGLLPIHNSDAAQKLTMPMPPRLEDIVTKSAKKDKNGTMDDFGDPEATVARRSRISSKRTAVAIPILPKGDGGNMKGGVPADKAHKDDESENDEREEEAEESEKEESGGKESESEESEKEVKRDEDSPAAKKQRLMALAKAADSVNRGRKM